MPDDPEFDAEGRRERIDKAKAIDRLLRDSSIGDDAWIECPRHGHTARDPYTRRCVECR